MITVFQYNYSEVLSINYQYVISKKLIKNRDKCLYLHEME